MMPAVADIGVADAVDAFCERVAFSPAETARFLTQPGASAYRSSSTPTSFRICMEANWQRGTRRSRPTISNTLMKNPLHAMSTSGTVAVLLPGAFYTLRETQRPPIDALRRHGTPIAIATDCNPGTSPLSSLLLAMNMAATFFRLTVTECLAGVTRQAARALGRQTDVGSLESGKWCDLAIWDVGAARRACLPHRVKSAAPAHLERSIVDVGAGP